MSLLKFEGTFEELTDKQLHYICNVLEKRGFVDNKIVFAPVGKDGDNYAANVKRITVELENGENFSMVAKIGTATETTLLMMNIEKIFNNEALIYTEIFRKFTKLQESANVPIEEILKYPQCYGCNTETPDKVILLEDLEPRNFKILDRFQSLPDEAVKLIMKNFAILHSLSYVLKKIEPGTYNSYASKLFDLWNARNVSPEFSIYMTNLEKDVLRLFENYDDKYKNAIRGACTVSSKLSNQYVKQDADSQYSVIQQGDAWTNNMMFKSENDQLKECIMVDYQLSKSSNPAGDILYMVFNCTDYKTRAEHFNEWLDCYHKHLDKSLHYFGMKASIVYPKDQLDADIKKYSKVYFGSAIMILSMIVRKSEEATIVKDAMMEPDPTKAGNAVSVLLLSSETNDLYKSRVRQLIDSLYEFGLI